MVFPSSFDLVARAEMLVMQNINAALFNSLTTNLFMVGICQQAFSSTTKSNIIIFVLFNTVQVQQVGRAHHHDLHLGT